MGRIGCMFYWVAMGQGLSTSALALPGPVPWNTLPQREGIHTSQDHTAGAAMRSVILHIHLPKTGGTTLSAILDREFGRRHCNLSFFRLKAPDVSGSTHVPWRHVGHKYKFSDIKPDWDFGEGDLLKVLKGSGDVAAVSRHGMVIEPSTIDAMAEGRAGRRYRLLPLFFLRRFLPWHVSLYHQQRRDPEYMVRLSSDPEVMVAKTGTLSEYTRYCVDSEDSRRRHRCMYNWTASSIDGMLARIEMYQFGLVERYDESLVVMEDALRDHFPGLDLSYGWPLNVGRPRPDGTPAQCMRGIERQLGADLVEGLARMGEQSEKLYARVDTELDSRVLRVANFRDKLGAFKERCRARRDAGG